MKCHIHVQEMMALDGSLFVYVRIGEPKDVPDHEQAFELGCSPQQIPFSALAAIPVENRDELSTELVREVGEKLLDGLSNHAGIRNALDRAANLNNGDGCPIIIETSAIDAESLPWEVLHHPQGRFMSLDSRWPMSRVTGSGGQVPLLRATNEPVRITAVIAAADRPGKPEWEALYGAIERSGLSCRVSLFLSEIELKTEIDGKALEGVTTSMVPNDGERLLDELKRERPQILHFFCHGSKFPSGFLEIDTRNSRDLGEGPIYVNGDSLGRISDDAWLVTLNACEGAAPAERSHSLAYELVRFGVPAAIGMREPIDSRDAHIFCRTFYKELFDWIDVALQSSEPKEIPWADFLRAPRQALFAQHGGLPNAARHKEWTLPVLYRRPEGLMIKAGNLEEGRKLETTLETLRKFRELCPPDTPQSMLDEVDLQIATLMDQLLSAT